MKYFLYTGKNTPNDKRVFETGREAIDAAEALLAKYSKDSFGCVYILGSYTDHTWEDAVENKEENYITEFWRRDDIH